MFLFNIPGLGNVSVDANTKTAAITALQSYLQLRGINPASVNAALDQGSRVPNTNIPAGTIALGGNGLPADGSSPTESHEGSGLPRLPGGGSGNPETPINTNPISEGGDGIETDQGTVDRRLLGEIAQPFGAFQNFLGRQNIGAASPLQGAASRFFNPAQSAFLLGNVTGQVSGQGATPFQDFLRNIGIGGVGSAAANVLQGLGGQDAAQAAEVFRGAGQGGVADAILESPSFQQFLQGVTPGTELGQTLSQLGQGALAARTSPLFASRFGRQFIGGLEDQFNRTVASGAIGPSGQPATSFLDLLRSSIL